MRSGDVRTRANSQIQIIDLFVVTYAAIDPVAVAVEQVSLGGGAERVRGVALNERDDEYYYKDIVAVSTREESTNYQLPNRAVMRQAQAFTMSVASGERISVIVNSAELRWLTGGAPVADSGADGAIKALRKTLADKKME